MSKPADDLDNLTIQQLKRRCRELAVKERELSDNWNTESRTRMQLADDLAKLKDDHASLQTAMESAKASNARMLEQISLANKQAEQARQAEREALAEAAALREALASARGYIHRIIEDEEIKLPAVPEFAPPMPQPRRRDFLATIPGGANPKKQPWEA